MAISKEFIEKFCLEAKKTQVERAIPNFGLSIVSPLGDVELVGGPNIDTKTLFPIGSLSKAFAATLIGLLVDKGLIKWTDSINKYIDFKLPNDINLTIDQILRQINPFPEHSLTQASEFGFTRQELLNKLQYITIEKNSFKFSYQNVLFSVIADVVEKITGKKYEEVLKKELLIPLGMTNTLVDAKNYLDSQNKTIPHIKHVDKIENIPYSPYWHIMGPPSCVATSVSDLIRWIKLNLKLENTSLISENSLSNIHSPIKKTYPPYAMGWWQADEKGLVLCHTGSVTGYESVIAIIPSLKVGIAMCSNLSGDSFPYELLSNFIQEVLNDKTFYCTNVLSLQMTLKKSKINYERLVGNYYHPILENIKISLQDDNLTLVVGKNKTQAILTPIILSANHSKISIELSQLASHHCFQIHWKSNMESAGKLYYDDDKLAFVENKFGLIDSIILSAEAISRYPITLKYTSNQIKENNEILHDYKNYENSNIKLSI